MHHQRRISRTKFLKGLSGEHLQLRPDKCKGNLQRVPRKPRLFHGICIPKADYCTSFPCSVKAQRCINADACSYQMDNGSIDLDGKRDCNFNVTEIELDWEDQCIEGHAGKLCGECIEDTATPERTHAQPVEVQFLQSDSR